MKQGNSKAVEEEEVVDAPFEPTFPPDLLKLRHSFGYDCKRLYNLWLINDDTLVFASGNYLHYFQLSTGQITYRESVNGAGIGFITTNASPNYRGLLTIGENGKEPVVFIYEYPSHKIRIRLDGAAKNCFTCGSYNTTGELLATQAGHPDFMMTIWRWQTAEVMLRSKSFQNNVLHVHFSAFNPILLVSCGLSHIKFWKMANTFTGLKLQGDLGRFGKTDFSDIYAVCMMPDESVISGCEWGNMLVWEAGLIKFEVCRTDRRPCHKKPISRITFDEGEVMTVGMDGYARVWFWEPVDIADPPDDDRFVEIEPIHEFYIPGCEIRSLQKIKLYDDNHYGYYAQDGNGGIWYVDLNKTVKAQQKPRKLYNCHGGKIIAAQFSPTSRHFLTMGEEGKLILYDYWKKKLVLEKSFNTVGTDLLWFNTFISTNGMEVVAGFNDGVLRHLFIQISTKQPSKMILVRAIKAHASPVTRLAVNPKNTTLVTSSADFTCFMYSLTDKEAGLIVLQPVGYIEFNTAPLFLTWRQDKPSTLLIGSVAGEVYEFKLPSNIPEEQTYLSYRLTEFANIKSYRFVSVKSRIRRDIKREETKKRKEKKRQRKLVEIERLKAANPGLQIDLETALVDSEPEEEEEELYVPPVPSPIIWLKYIDKRTIWLNMGGYDAGYIYEVQFGQIEPLRSTMIPDGDDCEIHSYLEINDFLLFGMINGKIRINWCNPNNFRDLTDYRLFNMHDIFNGRIPRIIKSYDGAYIVSIGNDGNVFLYEWSGPRVKTVVPAPQRLSIGPELEAALAEVEDIDDPEHLSLEQKKILDEEQRQAAAAAAHEREVLTSIADLQERFDDIMRQNKLLPKGLRIPQRELLLDDRITKEIGAEMQFDLEDVREDLAYDMEVVQVGKQKLDEYFFDAMVDLPFLVTAVRADIECFSFRLEKLGASYDSLKADLDFRLLKEAKQRGPPPAQLADERDPSLPLPGVETFFFGRKPESIVPRFSKKMLRVLLRYRSRQFREIAHVYNWAKIHRQEPDPTRNHPVDERNLREAEQSLGDYKLKIGANYEPKPHENLTYKAYDILSLRAKIFEIEKQFNEKLYKMRGKKQVIYKYLEEKLKRLNALHNLMPEVCREYLEGIREVNMDDEFPEANLVEQFPDTCGIQINDIIYLDKSIDDLLEEPPEEIPPVDPYLERDKHQLDQFYSLGVAAVKAFPPTKDLRKMLEKLPKTTQPHYFDMEAVAAKPAPFLVEKQYRWIIRMLANQANLLTKVNAVVDQFDMELTNLVEERMRCKAEIDFIWSNLIALNQELFILRDSEQIEESLLAKAEVAMKTRNDMQLIINASKRQIEESRKNIERLNEQIAGIQAKFLTTTKGHKFLDFLRRIFKKKYKPPKPPKVGEESSETSTDDESSTEEENADAKSVDSTDMTTIRLDEDQCPPGLERPMYELAFKLRADRHALEQAVLEQYNYIDDKKREVGDLLREMRYHEEVYDRENRTLLEFRRKRQTELNKVKVSVVIKMSQLQHFRDGEDFHDLTEAILFDGSRLRNLQRRAETLNREAIEARRLHRLNIVHLRRMNTDITFMRFEAVRLEEAIKDAMLKKFGIILNLNDLEEEVLRRHVFELETNCEEALRAIEKETAKRREMLAKYQQMLILQIKRNTHKYNMCAVLQEEKNSVDDMLALQDKTYGTLKPRFINWDRDIEKLRIIEKQQKEEIKCLEREICLLRSKPNSLKVDERYFYKMDIVDEVSSEPEYEPSAEPEILSARTYGGRMIPNDDDIERVNRIVVKYFLRHLLKVMNKELIRTYAKKVGRYLSHAAYNFEGSLSDDVFDYIIDQMKTLLPKKYMLHFSHYEFRKMLNEIHWVFDFERSELNVEDLMSGILIRAKESLSRAIDILNKTQFVMLDVMQHLVEVLTLDELLAEDNFTTLVNVLSADLTLLPKCIDVEDIVSHVTVFARENLLDTIMCNPFRGFVINLRKELLARRKEATPQCSIDNFF